MLYEDDFEFEEQPADVRDRTIGGRSGGGRNGGGNRRRPPSRRGHVPETRHEVPDQAKPARDLLADILTRMGIGPVDIGYIVRPEGEYLEVNGPDLAALIGRHGNTLEALNLVFNNAFNAGVKNNRHYYTIDAEGYRAHRADQLKRLAMQTVDRCVRNGTPQKLDPMLPSERKIIHLTLADSGTVRTESEGEEPERRVVIFPR